MNNVLTYKETIVIPTYRLNPDDLNPMFDARLNPYPYTLQNSLSTDKVDVEYESVVIENEYLKLTIIPSLGGRLYSAFDKVNRKEMFYRNPVIKPRLLATRGAWISGGVEFNFPISHSPATMDRMNYTVQSYEDGSASIIFGNIEMISFMNWKVELKLHPDKAYIEENVRLYNPAASVNRFYFWTNAAVEYNKSVELIYPFDWCINCIEQNYIKWPYYKGTDYSKAKNVPFGYETFGKLLTDNFFGVYNYQNDYGVVHYADRKKIKGAKFFSWGNDGMASAWTRALTDDESWYLEIQSGPFESQGVFKFLKPHQQLSWSEFWYPVSGTEGFKYAEKEMALNYKYEGNKFVLTFYPLADMKGCTVILKDRANEYIEKKDFIACKCETVVFNINNGFERNAFDIAVINEGKKVLCLENREKVDLEFPEIDIYNDSRTTSDGHKNQSLFIQAKYYESLGDFGKAMDLYNENLLRHPGCTITLNCIGRLYLKKSMLKEAGHCFSEVLHTDNADSEARFFLSMVEKEKGNMKAALRLMSDISCDSEYYSASVLEQIKLDIYFKYFRDAATIMENNSMPDNPYFLFLESICRRVNGSADLCGKILEKAGSINGFANEYILAEKFISGCSIGENDDLKRYTGGDECTLSAIAMEYLDMDLLNDAKAILGLVANPGIKTKALLMYINNRLGCESNLTVESIFDCCLDYVFINEKRIVKILEDQRFTDKKGKIDYLLGVYYYSTGRKDEALSCLISSYEKGLRYTVLLYSLGYVYLNHIKDNLKAEEYFMEDILLNNGINERSILALNLIFKEKSDIESRKKLLPYMEKAGNRSFTLHALVDIYLESGQGEKALSMLETEEFQNWEGGENSGALYKDVIINMAMQEVAKGNYQKAREYIQKADVYPVGLNYGDSLRTPLSCLYYHKGLIYSFAGDEESAKYEFTKGALELEDYFKVHTDESRKFSIMCLKELKKRV